VEFAIGVSMSTPTDVNREPQCELLSLPCTSPRTFPDFGISFAAGLNVTDWFGLVGEISLYNNNWVARDSMNTVNHLSSYLAGPRLRVHLTSSSEKWAYDIHVFGQVLAGNVTSQSFPGGRAIQPGAGIDFHSPRGFDIRVQYDHCFLPGQSRDLPGDRILLGVVFGIGDGR
jgi:hypothetical protein